MTDSTAAFALPAVRYSEKTLSRVLAAAGSGRGGISPKTVLRAAAALSGSGSYLDARELARGLSVALRARTPYGKWLRSAARTRGVVSETHRVDERVAAALAAAARQARHLTRLVTEAPPDMRTHVAFPVFSPGGTAGAESIAYAVVKRGTDGLPDTGDEGSFKFYYRVDRAFESPAYWGPFVATQDGVVAPHGELPQLSDGAAYNSDSVGRVYSRAVECLLPGISATSFLRSADVKGLRSPRRIIDNVLDGTLGKVTRIDNILQGDKAIAHYLGHAYADHTQREPMRAILERLATADANAAVYEATVTAAGQTTEVLVFVDKAARGLGFFAR